MENLKRKIATAFANVEYPGDLNLRNSDEGDEPFLLEAAFQGKQDWAALPAAFIDQAPDGYATALSFFSAAAFRFYLPAYLLADLDGALLYTDPIFYLTYGLTNATKDVRINPARYGELSWYQYVSERFSGFSQNEVRAIIAYLGHKQGLALSSNEREEIDQALANYWLQRIEKTAA